MPIKTISAARTATAFDLRPNLVAWFLGAGASAGSGIPSRYAMIRDFKAQIFCRETKLPKLEIDTAEPFPSLGGWSRIDRVINGELAQVVRDLDENIWKDAG